ncbi:hypothetical protein GGR53DRAFT_489068 [Hypoxylon sp. FL1150]|nr:hypothetical protein GGR53DRAFT_489068 [Hypoxylon sp. FL1150]
MSPNNYTPESAPLRKRRVLQDIKELIEDPYPNITLHLRDDKLERACLILTPGLYKPLHLTIFFYDFPMVPPQISMDSDVKHPNVFGHWICATILRNGEEYTPAYTLKGIAIQLLSFFSSESVEQEDNNNEKRSLDTYAASDQDTHDDFKCEYCQFGHETHFRSQTNSFNALVESDQDQWPTLPKAPGASLSPEVAEAQLPRLAIQQQQGAANHVGGSGGIERLPDELLLDILERLDFIEMTAFAAAWERVSNIIGDYDLVRQRELQCFCLKEDYRSLNLGIGVSYQQRQIASEFDLISDKAFTAWRQRESINGSDFNHWLPLPISHPHWRRVKDQVPTSLEKMKGFVSSGKFGHAQVIIAFMNDVVVRLNLVAEEDQKVISFGSYSYRKPKSTLRHASEKAIESYFHLFHLLVCMATDDPSLVQQANRLLQNFMGGKQSKTDCPNLGHLLIALLISDVEVTEGLIKSIITEAITRNVVWLFDKKGANMPELSYMESAPVSAYRLDKTFDGSRTSYRLLMFSELFRRTARPSHQKPLSEVREELFARHGAPPRGAAQELSATVRRLHTINDFPAFLREMGIRNVPDPRSFTNLLRKTVQASMDRGYSKWGMERNYALLLRKRKDEHVDMTGDEPRWIEQNINADPYAHVGTFFPGNKQGGKGQGNRGGRGGRGRGRGLSLSRGGRR